MIDVNVQISGIAMCCNENLCKLNIGNNYSFEKLDLDALPFKEEIIDGKGHLSTDYYGSRILSKETVSFVCLRKDDVFRIQGPIVGTSGGVLTDEDLMCDKELSQYSEKEIRFLNEKVNLLRLFKPGNIGFRDLFFKYSFSVMEIVKNTLNYRSHFQTRNTIANEIFELDDSEVTLCNQWLSDYSGAPYGLLKECIDEFSWGLEQIDVPTGFEQYTTALEMALLPQNQLGKKQMLANRISAMLGTSVAEIQQIHQKITNFYRYRSESLHDGDGSNITNSELHELETITRAVLKECLIRCKTEYNTNPQVTWSEIKRSIMNDLVNRVTGLKKTGVLPL